MATITPQIAGLYGGRMSEARKWEKFKEQQIKRMAFQYGIPYEEAKEIFKDSSFHMIDVSSKKETFRRALASGKIYVGEEVFNLIKNKKMPKGDPITLAEVSAVLGVKKTSELIPLCHPLPIDHTATKIIMNEVDNSLEVFCVVSAVAKTGVEMEAIMGVNAALITIYDLSKIVNPHLKIDNVKLLIKEGGKSGLWTNPDGLPEFLKNIF